MSMLQVAEQLWRLADWHYILPKLPAGHCYDVIEECDFVIYVGALMYSVQSTYIQ